MDISVIITSYHDEKIHSTIESLLEQELEASQIIIVESSSEEFYEKLCSRWEGKDPIKFVRTPEGYSVAEARNKALEAVKGDIVCFLDTDEIAPEHWLKRITKPIRNKEADFTGGPTKNIGDYKYRDYFQKREDYFYKYIVSKNPETIPMGNSAWKKEVFDKLDGFDDRLNYSGEDWDVNIRAVKNDFKGKFVPNAWVYHNQSSLDSALKIIKKKYKYNVGGAMAHLKNDWLKERGSREGKIPFSKQYFHWLEFVDPIIKPFALASAYRRCKKEDII